MIGKNTARFRQQWNTDDFDVDSGVADISETEARLHGRLGRKIGYSLIHQSRHFIQQSKD
jgi:hypothetical protein